MHRLDKLDLGQEKYLLVGEGDIFLGLHSSQEVVVGTNGGDTATTHRRVADGFHQACHVLYIADAGHHHAHDPGVEELQDQLGVGALDTGERGHPDGFAGADELGRARSHLRALGKRSRLTPHACAR